MKKRNVEILAPAGSYESMTAAVLAGADAVYIGGSRFGARAYANNLDEEKMIQAIDFVHLHGSRIYMTVNTLVKEGELAQLGDYLRPYYEAGLDAVIVQDLGVFSYIREHFPDLHIHVSTQMTVTGPYSAAMLKDMGAVRVVPARELSLEEIRDIYDQTGLEVETFVHGALCYGYSGQCLFSSLIGGRSGNRGRCAQTCRLPFDVLRNEKYLNKKNEKYVLSLKDLCTLDLLPDILEAGVCSLKIEGRMKSPRYTAGVVSIYRKYVDLYLKQGRAGYKVDPADRAMLLDLFDRGGQCDGYYKQHNGRDMVVLKEKPTFREGNQALFDYLDRTYVEAVKKEKINGTAYFEPGKPMQLTLELPLFGSLAEQIQKKQETAVSVGRDWSEKSASASALLLRIDGDIVEEAKNAPMDEARIRKQLMKTGDSPFTFETLSIEVQGNIFVPVQALNTLRREALERLEGEILKLFRRTLEPVVVLDADRGNTQEFLRMQTLGHGHSEAEEQTREFTALVNSPQQFEVVFGFMKARNADPSVENGWRFGIYLASEEFAPSDWKQIVDRCHEADIACYLMMPRIFRKEAEKYFLKHMESLKEAGFDALGVASMEEPGFVKQNLPDMPMYFDHGMYVFNHLAAQTMACVCRESKDETAQMAGTVCMGFGPYSANRLTIPVELNAREIRESGIQGEMIVYGRLPMMVSAQCIRKTTDGCSRKPEILYLKDRKGKEFPVRNQCRFCYNTIYNESPLSLLGLSNEILALNPTSLRLNFTVEDQKMTETVITAFYGEFVEGKKEKQLPEFTRGHFKRGVE